MPDLQKTKSERLICDASKWDVDEARTFDPFESEV